MDNEPIIISSLLEGISEHMRDAYNSIKGKELYPVAFNPLDEEVEWYSFKCKAKYPMIR